MMLALSTDHTIPVHCPVDGCATTVLVPYTTVIDRLVSDTAIVRIRVDHASIDSHVREYHGPGVLA